MKGIHRRRLGRRLSTSLENSKNMFFRKVAFA